MPPKPRSIQGVAFLLPSLGGGGAERVYATIARKLAERGILVDMVLLRGSGAFLGKLDPRVRVVDLAVRSKVSAVPALARYLLDDPREVLLSAMDVMNVTALLARALARSRIPVVVTSHLHMSSQIRYETRFQDRAVRSLARLLYPLADGVIAVSEGVADDVAKNAGIHRSRTRVIFNPIDLQAILEESRRSPDHPWARDNRRRFILSSGRLVPQKDLPTLLRAFALLRRTTDISLIVLGEGPERNALEQLAAELAVSKAVSLPGFVENPFPLLAQAEAFVLSSRFEGFGLVLAEALALGRPIVSTDCPSGPREILDNGRFGTLVPVGDHEALAEAIKGAITHPVDPKGLTERAECFHADAIASEYLETLEDAVWRSATGKHVGGTGRNRLEASRRDSH